MRVLLAGQGFPPPVLQAELTASDGDFVARVDFLFPDERVVVEFDGETKYGDGPAEAVIAEKWREDRIRELGYIVVRVSWSDLAYRDAAPNASVVPSTARAAGTSSMPGLSHRPRVATRAV